MQNITIRSGLSYAQSGVNIELGDEASKILYEAARATWKNREGLLGEIVNPFDDFSGVRAIDVSNLQTGTLLCLGFDGVGTKTELAERLVMHDTIAFDLFAMVCDDAVVRGGEPVIVGSVLDVNTLGTDKKSYLDLIRQLATGYISAAKEAGVAVINGEIAELGARVSGHGNFNYNWSAGVIWFAQRDSMFTGREIQVNDYIVGLKEDGFRSNGLSLVRKVLSTTYGDSWHEAELGSESLAELALTPSRVYSKAAAGMFGGYDRVPGAVVHGIAHITGGGIPGKLGRVLKPLSLGAVIDDPIPPCELMLHCQEIGNVEDAEAYRTWNMGQGMVIITPEPDGVMKIASDHAIDSKVIGKVVDGPGINIKSKGFYKKGRELKF